MRPVGRLLLNKIRWRPVQNAFADRRSVDLPIRRFSEIVSAEAVADQPCYSTARPSAAPKRSRKKREPAAAAGPAPRAPAELSLSARPSVEGVPFEQRVYRVDSREKARSAAAVLRAHPGRVYACDTEVSDIDLKQQGPVGNGKVTCVSIYGGPGLDFGEGSDKNVLWIDNMDENEDLISEFEQWFNDDQFKKVWHNYGFDRHVMFNEGIDCRGFAGDTMHMARLWDTGRSKVTGGGAGYSLAALSSELVAETDSSLTGDEQVAKTSMLELFGIPRTLSSGGASKVLELPSIRDLQTNPNTRNDWIVYSAKDAYVTWQLYEALKDRLENMKWTINNEIKGTMFDFYQRYWLPFGVILTDMERIGIRVDIDKLKAAEEKALLDRAQMERRFIAWASKQCSGGKHINAGSKTQVGQLLFGKYVDGKLDEREVEFEKEECEEQHAREIEDALQKNPYANMTSSELKATCKARGLKIQSKTKLDLISGLLSADAADFYENMTEAELKDVCNTRNISVKNSQSGQDFSKRELTALILNDEEVVGQIIDAAATKMPKKKMKFTIKTIGVKPESFTPGGTPQVSHAVLSKLAGENLFGEDNDAKWGNLYGHCGGGTAGAEACRAVGALAQMSQIDTTIQTFLRPLQSLVDKDSRIHCSLNLNTETGRLSSRAPNLQNQPALEKDKYKIRDSFCARPGNTLIVADYGQLELRLMAHMTDCQSMIDAFEKGGCFHSRTAMGMYSYIREAVNDGSVLLEWDYSKGSPPAPLVKDKYGSERRKAKTLNFSIAYGKTAFGLANDWGTTKAQAEETLKAWYADRPEVESWQKKTQAFAKKQLYVTTLMGRRRNLPHAADRGKLGSGSLRAAINTPIQGGAADVVVMAMIKISESEKLKNLGYRLLLQIHDEVILEGPKESASEALAELKKCMEAPFDDYGLKKLQVKLEVDAKTADTWYEAK